MCPVAASGGLRQAPVDIELGGLRIPARTQLWVPIHALLNSPRNWDRPGEFLPGRWADPDAEFAVIDPSKVGPGATARGASDPAASPGAAWMNGASNNGEGAGKRPRRFLPFLTGARDCVGQSLAKMNYTATLALLLSAFSFRLAKEVRALQAQELLDILVLRCNAACCIFVTRVHRRVAALATVASPRHNMQDKDIPRCSMTPYLFPQATSSLAASSAAHAPKEHNPIKGQYSLRSPKSRDFTVSSLSCQT